MTTSEESMKEEEKVGGDIQETGFISMSHFNLLKWLIKRVYSPLLLLFHFFIMPVWTCISFARESYWGSVLRTSSSQCHSNPVLVPPCKPPDSVKDLYEGHNYDLETRLDIWKRTDVVQWSMAHLLRHSTLWMWFFQFITGIISKWDYVMWHIIDLLAWIGHWTKLSIYKVPPDPVRLSYQGFGSLWRAFVLIWMLWSKNDLKVFHRKQVNATSNMNLATSLMSFECQPCDIFEVFHTINNMEPWLLISLRLL